MSTELVMAKPDDWHLHLRDNELMTLVVKDTARFFGRAMVMPNLKTPVSTLDQASAYQQRILDALPQGADFIPLMTLYLTADTPLSEIEKAHSSQMVLAMKLYPAGATTNSSAGIQHIDQSFSALETMQKIGMVLSIHGEVTDESVDIFDRERVFIDRILTKIVKQFPELKIVLEHLTTAEGVQFIEESGPCTAATITAHHLTLNRNDLLVGGIKPHLYCLPVVKTEIDRQTLLKAATSENPKFFLGTDSAPHLQRDKESSIGKAGIYSANSALLIYAEIFESVDKLDRLEGFASHHGADFYGIDRNQHKIKLIKNDFHVPDRLNLATDSVVPLKAGETISWNLAESNP